MASRLTSLQIGSVVTALAAGVGLGVYGSSIVTDNVVNFTPTGTSTGVVLQLNGVTQYQVFTSPFTLTGGNVKVSGGAKYNTAIMASPLTTTGAIQTLSIECGSVPYAQYVDTTFTKSRLAAGTGTAIPQVSEVQTGTGRVMRFSTGSLLWNPADFITVKSLTAPTGSAAADCVLRVTLYDKYGS